VISNSKGETLGYGAVVKEAAKLSIPGNIKLKNPKDFKIIGKDIRNVDLDKIVSGVPLFGFDYKVEGMLIATVLRPPSFGQKLVSYDASEAERVSGVVKVFRIGDRIAVLGLNTWASISGKKVVKATWSSNKKFDSTEQIDDKLTKLFESTRSKNLRNDGDIEMALSDADTVIEEVYEAPFLPHNCMEPINFYANVTKTKVYLAGSTQTPGGAAKAVSKLLSRDVNDVSLDLTRMGGGFGRRLKNDYVLEAAEISNKAKKPIKLVLTREDDMTLGVYRPSMKYKIKGSIKSGSITGYHLKEAGVRGGMNKKKADLFPALAIPNLKVDTARLRSEVTIGAWRSPIFNFLAFAEQSFMDELAHTLKKDPIEVRLELLNTAKSNKNKGMEYVPERMIGVVNLVREKSNWTEDKKGVFRGFSAYFSHNTYVAEVAEVVLKEGKPVVTKVYCAVDCGVVVNPLGANNQIVGGIIDGIGHAMYGDQTLVNGAPQNSNFDNYRLIRMRETPKVEAFFVDSHEDPTGLGEPSLPPAAAAVANAIFSATGARLRKQPFAKYFEL
jgi:isoquinoline 1-oxidoreductase beta subunit